MNKMFIRFVLSIAVLAMVKWMIKYTHNSPTPVQVQAALHIQDSMWNVHVIDSAVHMLADGQVVLRMGKSTQSRLLANINRQDKQFSHCGIVLIEDNYPFVYHSIGGEDNPDARLRRDSASHFFSDNTNMALAIVKYDFPAAILQSLRSIVDSIYQQKPRFDTHFDIATANELYCTEFVRCVLIAATADTGYIPLSIAIGRSYVGTDNLYLNKHAAFVWQVKFK